MRHEYVIQPHAPTNPIDRYHDTKCGLRYTYHRHIYIKTNLPSMKIIHNNIFVSFEMPILVNESFFKYPLLPHLCLAILDLLEIMLVEIFV